MIEQVLLETFHWSVEKSSAGIGKLDPKGFHYVNLYAQALHLLLMLAR